MGRLKTLKDMVEARQAAAISGERISTRFPSAGNRTEDPLTENLIINTDAMRLSPKAFEKNAQIVGDYNTTKTLARSAEGKVRAFLDEASDNLLWLYGQVRPEVRDVSKLWYVGANRFANDIANKYGISVESASAVLASLSPQKDWYQNASLAERVADIATIAKRGNYTRPDSQHAEVLRSIYDKPQYANDLAEVLSKPYDALSLNQKAMFVRSYDQAFNDRSYDIISPDGERVRKATIKSGANATTAWGSNAEISKAISVFEDPSIENISRQMGEMHKVRNFYNNIVDPEHARGSPEFGDITSDTHAVAASLLKPLGGSALEVSQNFGGGGAASSSITGAQGTYGLHADAYRRAAREAGIMPREMQSITWEAIRGLFPASFKTANNVKDINEVWELYNRGKISKENARDLVLAKAGGMADPDWVVRPDSGVHVPVGNAVDQGGLPQSGVSRPDSGVDGRARLIAAGMPAAWLGLGGLATAGLLGSESAEAAPLGYLAKATGMKTRQAYHGSPHDIPVDPETGRGFSLDKIGTGEGAQTYGHGLYFSSKKDIAKWYRDTLSEPAGTYEYLLDGKVIDDAGGRVKLAQFAVSDGSTADFLRNAEATRDQWQAMARQSRLNTRDPLMAELDALQNQSRADMWQNLIDEYGSHDVVRRKSTKKAGSLYEVEIPDESLMLDWNKPLSAQPEQVRSALETFRGTHVAIDEALDKPNKATGAGFYKTLSAALGDNNGEKASPALRQLGVPGITYKGRTSGERNFVVFDDKLINVVEKGAIDPRLLAPVAAAGAAAGYATRDPGELPPLDPAYAEFANRRATKQPLWNQLKEEVGVIRRPVTDRFRAGLDVAADFSSAMVGPTLSAFPTLVNYLHGHSADEMRERRDALNAITNYQPRTALGQAYSDNAAEAAVGALVPLLHVGSKLTQPLHPLIRWAAEKTGEREKVALEAAMDLLPF